MAAEVLTAPGGPLTGTTRVGGDKAISHRAALLASAARGRSRIRGFSTARDCLATLAVVRALGGGVEVSGTTVAVRGASGGSERGLLDCGRSGTTMRLAAGLVAGRPGQTRLSGDPQLRRRPMERVAEPLRLMGAEVETAPGGRPPISIRGGGLRGIEYRLPVASAQVKSAVLLAGLAASGATSVIEEVPTRDHTERLLRAMGAGIELAPLGSGLAITIRTSQLDPFDLRVPGDASSAAVIATAAALVPGSDVVLSGVGCNPGRMGFFTLLAQMGAGVEFTPEPAASLEPSADIRIRQAPLRAFRIAAPEVPGLIDEIPLLGLLATAAEGTSEVRGAQELRVKESDRIRGLVRGLRQLGAVAEELPDGFVVRGPVRLRGGACDSQGDHRLAMTLSLAGLVSLAPARVRGAEMIADSFPGFAAQLRALC